MPTESHAERASRLMNEVRAANRDPGVEREILKPKGESYSSYGQVAKQRALVHKSAGAIIRKIIEAHKGKEESLFIQMIKAAAETACNPRSPQQIAALIALMDRAYGKPKPSDEELDALKRSGITVILNQPVLDSPVVTKPALPPQPDFLLAEVVEE